MINLQHIVNNIFHKRTIYLISDTHFDHSNIIRYSHRPFSSVFEMNSAIIRNWNSTVKKDDIVYFLGDWGFGRGHRPAAYWISRLNGKIISIRGSHDHGQGRQSILHYKILKTNKHTFLLVHDPNDSRTWKGWLIHGHIHNSKMDKYPFINGNRKTINVSVELTSYTPISLDFLESLDIDSIRWMRTSTSVPERN